jgi:ribose transport system permease protein
MIDNGNIIKGKLQTWFGGSTFSIMLAFIAISVVFAILSPHYLTFQNFKNMGLYASFTGIMAAGLTVAMLLGGLDLSQHAIAALTTILTTIFVFNMQMPLGLAIPLVFIIGIICGLLNGFIVARLNINPIIATMGSQYIIRGICYILTEGRTITFKNEFLNTLGRGYILGVPNSVWIMAIVFVVISFVLNKTRYGRSVYAVGANPKASYLSGISTINTKIVAYAISAFCASIAGLIIVAQVGAAVPSSGVGSEMEIIAAVILGGLALTGGKGKLMGTFFGLMVIVSITNGLTLLSVQSYYQIFVRGFIILVAVYIDSLRTVREYA